MPRRIVGQAAHVRIVAAVVGRRSFASGRLRLIRQAAGQVPSEVAAERRPADLGAALDELAAAGMHRFGFDGVPDAGEVRLAVGQPRRGRRQIGLAVGLSRHVAVG